MFYLYWKNSGPQGSKKKLNSRLTLGQVALKLLFSWLSVSLLFYWYSWKITWLIPSPLDKWEWKATCLKGKSIFPVRLADNFLEPWYSYFLADLCTELSREGPFCKIKTTKTNLDITTTGLPFVTRFFSLATNFPHFSLNEILLLVT